MSERPSQVCTVFSRLLTAAGYSVTTVDSSVAALQVLQTARVDLLILDLNMPQPDGFELLKQLHAHKPGLKILVVSGMVHGPVLKAAEIVGATATLSKTDAHKLLVLTVQSILDQ
jgi:CheY-like chemotaxis protein